MSIRTSTLIELEMLLGKHCSDLCGRYISRYVLMNLPPMDGEKVKDGESRSNFRYSLLGVTMWKLHLAIKGKYCQEMISVHELMEEN